MARRFETTVLALAVLVFAPAAYSGPTDPEITNYKTGIDVWFSGERGVDYTEEYFYHDKIIDDHKVVYLKSDTLIYMDHNETNKIGLESEIGKDGSDGIPSSGDEGIIRYKIDRDLQWKYAWAGTEQKSFGPLLPSYASTGPFSLNDLEYEPGVPVAGTTGPVPGVSITNKDDFYYRGLVDSFGDEWHVLAVADDDAWTENSFSEWWASDGKTILLVVDPKTPCLSLKALTSDAQFYTTPAKTYFLPQLHDQTTYLTGDVEISLTNIMGGGMQFRFDGAPFQGYQGPINTNSLSDGEHVLEYYYDPGHVKRRTIVKNPSYPSDRDVFPDGTGHGYLLWRDDAEFNRVLAQCMGSGLVGGNYRWWRKSRWHGHVDAVEKLRKGKRESVESALLNGIVIALEGAENYPSHGRFGKRMLLDSALNIDPLGYELHDSKDPSPCKERNYRGYYDVNIILQNALAYDLFIKHYRATEHDGGITPIEDYKIRDLLASFNIESMMYLGGFHYGSSPPTHINPSPSPGIGMWDTAREMGTLICALAMPGYDTPYFGTSGFDGTEAAHPWTPYRDHPASWKDVFFTYTDRDVHMDRLHGYPNQRRFFNQLDGGLITNEPKEINRTIKGELIEIIPPGNFADRIFYFNNQLMGHVFYTFANVLKIRMNKSYPWLELAFDHANKGELYGLKVSRSADLPPAQLPQLLLINEHFPNLAQDAFDYLISQSNDPSDPFKALKAEYWPNGILSDILFHEDFQQAIDALHNIPKIIGLRPANDSIEILWESTMSESVDSYTVYRSSTRTGPFEPIASGVTEQRHTDAGLSFESLYYYRITSHQTGQESPPSKTALGVTNAAFLGQDTFEGISWRETGPLLANDLSWELVGGAGTVTQKLRSDLVPELNTYWISPGRNSTEPSYLASKLDFSEPFALEFDAFQQYVDDDQGAVLLFQDVDNHYRVEITSGQTTGGFEIQRVMNGQEQLVGASSSLGLKWEPSSARYRIEVSREAGGIRFHCQKTDWITYGPATRDVNSYEAEFFDEDPLAASRFASGKVGFYQLNLNESDVAYYDNVLITPYAGSGGGGTEPTPTPGLPPVPTPTPLPKSKAFQDRIVFQADETGPQNIELVLEGQAVSVPFDQEGQKDDSTGIYLKAFGESLLTTTDGFNDWLRSNAESQNVILIDDNIPGPVDDWMEWGPSRSTVAKTQSHLTPNELLAQEQMSIQYGVVSTQPGSLQDLSAYGDRVQLDRHVVFVERRFFIVFDDLTVLDVASHNFGWTAHGAGTLNLVIPNGAIFTKPSGNKLHLRWFGPNLTFENYTLNQYVDGAQSPTEVPYVIANKQGQGAQFLTSLIPLRSGSPAPSYGNVAVSRGTAGRISLHGDDYLVFCQPDPVAPVQVAGLLDTTAKLAVAKLDGDVLSYVFVVDQEGPLYWADDLLFEDDQSVSSFVWERGENGIPVTRVLAFEG